MGVILLIIVVSQKPYSVTLHFIVQSVQFGSAIVIIRNPFDALVSEWTRKKSGDNHIGTVSHKHFGELC